MGRGLSRRITEHNFPDLPAGFVEWVKKTGREVRTLADVVEAYKEWNGRKAT